MDTASVLLEAMEYIRFLHEQVKWFLNGGLGAQAVKKLKRTLQPIFAKRTPYATMFPRNCFKAIRGIVVIVLEGMRVTPTSQMDVEISTSVKDLRMIAYIPVVTPRGATSVHVPLARVVMVGKMERVVLIQKQLSLF